MQFVEYIPWVQDFGISYHMGIDGISLFLDSADHFSVRPGDSFHLDGGRKTGKGVHDIPAVS